MPIDENEILDVIDGISDYQPRSHARMLWNEAIAFKKNRTPNLDKEIGY